MSHVLGSAKLAVKAAPVVAAAGTGVVKAILGAGTALVSIMRGTEVSYNSQPTPRDTASMTPSVSAAITPADTSTDVYDYSEDIRGTPGYYDSNTKVPQIDWHPEYNYRRQYVPIVQTTKQRDRVPYTTIPPSFKRYSSTQTLALKGRSYQKTMTKRKSKKPLNRKKLCVINKKGVLKCPKKKKRKIFKKPYYGMR